eukprot:760641-Hanusia_phi.AAC.3
MSLKLNRRSRFTIQTTYSVTEVKCGRVLCSPKAVSFLQVDEEESQRDDIPKDLEDSIARSKMAMRGFKSMSSISMKHNMNNHYNAEDDTLALESAISLSDEDRRVQMLRVAVRDQHIARSASAIESTVAKIPPKVSSIRAKKFSQSMPVNIVQGRILKDNFDREKIMGSVMEGMDRVSSTITPEALEYVKESLCSPKHREMDITEEELSLDQMDRRLKCIHNKVFSKTQVVNSSELVLQGEESWTFYAGGSRQTSERCGRHGRPEELRNQRTSEAGRRAEPGEFAESPAL